MRVLQSLSRLLWSTTSSMVPSLTLTDHPTRRLYTSMGSERSESSTQLLGNLKKDTRSSVPGQMEFPLSTSARSLEEIPRVKTTRSPTPSELAAILTVNMMTWMLRPDPTGTTVTWGPRGPTVYRQSSPLVIWDHDTGCPNKKFPVTPGTIIFTWMDDCDWLLSVDKACDWHRIEPGATGNFLLIYIYNI